MVTSRQGSRTFLAVVAARGRRAPQPGCHDPPGAARAVAGPPLLSPGDFGLFHWHLFYSHMVPVGRLLRPQRPPHRVPRRSPLPFVVRGTETLEKNGLCHPRPSGMPGETLIRLGLPFGHWPICPLHKSRGLDSSTGTYSILTWCQWADGVVWCGVVCLFEVANRGYNWQLCWFLSRH